MPGNEVIFWMKENLNHQEHLDSSGLCHTGRLCGRVHTHCSHMHTGTRTLMHKNRCTSVCMSVLLKPWDYNHLLCLLTKFIMRCRLSNSKISTSLRYSKQDGKQELDGTEGRCSVILERSPTVPLWASITYRSSLCGKFNPRKAHEVWPKKENKMIHLTLVYSQVYLCINVTYETYYTWLTHCFHSVILLGRGFHSTWELRTVSQTRLKSHIQHG